MRYTSEKLIELKKELTQITKEVERGQLTQKDAAERILHVREEMDKVIEYLRSKK